MSDLYSYLWTVAAKSLLVLAMAWLITFLMRRRSAAARHMIWMAAMAALLVLPCLSLLLPAVRVPVDASLMAPMFRTAALAGTNTAVSSGANPGAGSLLPAGPTPRISWPLLVVMIWAGGVLLGMVHLMIGWLRVAAARRRAEPFSHLSTLVDLLGFRPGAPVLAISLGAMPMTFGWFRPVILLPADAAEWSAERLRLVLLHELAHVRRGDTITHMLAAIAVKLYWWNPLAWKAWREFIQERERATDDLVLAAGARPSDYAGHLLEVARSLRPESGSAAAIAMARPSQLEGRLIAILDTRRNRRGAGRATAWALAFAAAAITLPLAAVRADDTTYQLPADVEATIRAAASQKNHEMLENAAKAAAAFSQYDLARKLLDSSLAIRANTDGEQSVAYGVGLIKIGDLERSRNNFKEAEDFYLKAVSVLGNRPEAAPVLTDLGTMALTRQAPSQALDYFQKAQAADPVHAGVSMMWMAVMAQKDRPNEVESIFRDALAVQDPNSAQAATTTELLANFLGQQGRADEANSLREQAKAVRSALASQSPSVRQSSSSPFAIRMGPGMTPPQLSYKVEPQYSQEARLAKYQGTVIVAVDIGTDGQAHNMRVVRGLGLGLDERAMQAISQWRFKPGTKDGQPVDVMATIEVNFRLL